MFSNLISKFNTNILLGIIVVVGVYSYFISSSLDSTKEKLNKKEKDYKELEISFNIAVQEYEKQLDFEKNKAIFETTTLKEKENVVRAASKVKEEIIKRGEVKDEKNSDFIVTKF